MESGLSRKKGYSPMYGVLVSSRAMEDSKYVESHVTAMDLQALSGAGLLLSFPEYYPLLLQWTE